ncbi:MAG: hypothetical protein H0U52_00465 [Chloroflexi bacterium]|nr:hypothetical protein [Chloroflexota bacterium]
MISPARTSASIPTIPAAREDSASNPAASADRRLVGGLGAAGGVLAITGSVLPWVSMDAGLQTIAGTDGLNGRILAGLGFVAALVAMVHAARGGQGTRWLLGIAGFTILGFGGWLGIPLLQTEAILAADPLLVSRLEPGLAVSLFGGSLLLATLFLPARSLAAAETPERRARTAAQFMLVAALAIAGVIHVALVPEHLRESIALGVGFLGAGLGQVGLAAIILRNPTGASLRLTLMLSIFSLVALVAAVTVGLPAFLDGSMGSMNGVLLPAESLSDLGAITGAVEVIAVVLAFRLLRRAQQRPA